MRWAQCLSPALLNLRPYGAIKIVYYYWRLFTLQCDDDSGVWRQAGTRSETCILWRLLDTFNSFKVTGLLYSTTPFHRIKGKGSPYSITERRVPELIPVLVSQPASDIIINPTVGCHYFPPGLQLPPQPLRGLLPILLLGEQRHNGCEQFAYDCYPTASRLRFEPGPLSAWVQHANHRIDSLISQDSVLIF